MIGGIQRTEFEGFLAAVVHTGALRLGLDSPFVLIPGADAGSPPPSP